jgi:hypothetical protein
VAQAYNIPLLWISRSDCAFFLIFSEICLHCPARSGFAAETVKPEKHTDATLLLNEAHFSFDEGARLVETRHLIYRIETQAGVEGWAETSGRWQAWHQAKPEIRARVITAEGAEHWLDPKTLSDVPVHENEPEVYSDERKYGGPLPAVAIGAIVEEELTFRDTTPLFAAGIVRRKSLAWTALVQQTHIVITHPESLPLHYQLHLLPDAKVTKTSDKGVETITLDQGPLPAYLEQWNSTPPDEPLYPELEFSTGTSWRQVAAEYARLSEDKLRPSEAQACWPRSTSRTAAGTIRFAGLSRRCTGMCATPAWSSASPAWSRNFHRKL